MGELLKDIKKNLKKELKKEFKKRFNTTDPVENEWSVFVHILAIGFCVFVFYCLLFNRELLLKVFM